MDALKTIKIKEDIKSKYNIEQIFSFLNKKQILKMIIYNKHLKEILSINIQDYIEESKKFKIGEKNGKGKEYDIDTNQIIFIGEYLNGKRNGKGKEYELDERRNKSNLKFQGEYLNGKRNGKGKEYNSREGKLIFEGEYLNGKRNGKGQEYYYNGDLKFEGEYLNEKIWNGKIYNPQGVVECEIKEGKGYIKEYTYSEDFLLYEGEYLNGERNGKGKEYFIYFDHEKYSYISQLEFEGEYKNGKKWNGKGKEYEFKGRAEFDGEYLNGEKWNGKARKYSNWNLNFEGEILNGKITKGKEYIYNQLYFEGEYLNDKKWNGKIYNRDGKMECEIKDGKGYIKELENGKGKEYYSREGILKYEGEYLNGKRNGKGKEYYENGKLKYEGEYLNGKKNGKVKEYYDNGELRFEGEYLNDERNGKVKEYYDNGKLRFEGVYLNKKIWNGKIYNPQGIMECEIKEGKGYKKEYDNHKKILIFEGEYLNGMEKEKNIIVGKVY